jgi:F0F1-type ATP synthase membrane subunit c/vacuolar-type H+-ATPase subunit K
MAKNTSNKARRDHMFRKMALILASTAALGMVALSPTSASAHWRGHHWGWGGFGVGLAAGLVGSAIVANTCVQRRVIETPYGPVVRWVNVCY